MRGRDAFLSALSEALSLSTSRHLKSGYPFRPVSSLLTPTSLSLFSLSSHPTNPASMSDTMRALHYSAVGSNPPALFVSIVLDSYRPPSFHRLTSSFHLPQPKQFSVKTDTPKPVPADDECLLRVTMCGELSPLPCHPSCPRSCYVRSAVLTDVLPLSAGMCEYCKLSMLRLSACPTDLLVHRFSLLFASRRNRWCAT